MMRPWLAPLVPIYAAGMALRNLRLRKGWERTQSLRYPVVSIGNLSAGGAGKTPLVITLTSLLKQRGFSVDVLSRGYGRQGTEPACVDPAGTAEQFGDEPLLIARATGVPVYVAPKRYDAGRLAEAATKNALTAQLRNVHLLDDGFQHRQLRRDVDILLLNRYDWGDAMIPAGNRRETREAVLCADVIAVPSDEPELESDLRKFGWTGLVWRLRRHMQVPAIAGPVLAFCGIARPGQFFSGLESAGLALFSRVAFRDHHPWSATDIERIAGAARNAGAKALVTTEKDFVRIGDLASKFTPDLPLRVVSLTTEIEDEEKAIDWLDGKLETSMLAGARRDDIGGS